MNIPPNLFDPTMAYAYAKHNASKGGSGDFVDFLLNYDEQKAKDGETGDFGNSLLDDDFLSSAMPTKAYQALQDQKLKSMSDASEFGVFNTQVAAYKLELVNAFKQRYEKSEKDESVRAAKIASLYELADNIKLPSRLVG